MRDTQFFEEFYPLYRLYHKNQNELVEPEYIADSTREKRWSTGNYKQYDRGSTVEPGDEFEATADDEVLTALRERHSFDDGTTSRPISRSELFRILACSYGINEETATRPIPSPGQLYPLEIYPLVVDSPDVDEGLYHYNPDNNVLERPADETYISEEFGSLHEFVRDNWYHLDDDHEINVMLLITGIPSRSSIKYGERGYMFTLIEVGALVQAIQIAAGQLQIGSRPYAGFRIDRASDLLGLTDHYQEWVVTSIALAGDD